METTVVVVVTVVKGVQAKKTTFMELLAILVIPVMTPLAPRLWTPHPPTATPRYRRLQAATTKERF